MGKLLEFHKKVTTGTLTRREPVFKRNVGELCIRKKRKSVKLDLNRDSTINANLNYSEASNNAFNISDNYNEEEDLIFPSELPKKSLEEIVSQGDPSRIFNVVKQIGIGSSGIVYLALDNRTKKEVALKKMALNQQIYSSGLVTEIQIMKEMQHKNIVNYVDSFKNSELWVCFF